MNKYQILCFSATGNTLYLAKYLGIKLSCDVIVSVGDINCEHLIIMSSIHAFKVPSFFKKSINNIKSLSIICVGCNDSFINYAAGYHLVKYAKRKNIELCLYQIVSMPLTIVKKFDTSYGKKIVDESVKRLEIFSDAILNDKRMIVKVPLKSKLFLIIHYIENVFVRFFGLELYANNNCIKCGLCSRNCPKKNIKMKNKPKFGLSCMMCMKCIYKCPKRAIHPKISKFVEFKDGYDLKEYL